MPCYFFNRSGRYDRCLNSECVALFSNKFFVVQVAGESRSMMRRGGDTGKNSINGQKSASMKVQKSWDWFLSIYYLDKYPEADKL